MAYLETNLASRWEGVRLPRASGKSPDFPGSSLETNVGSRWKGVRLPRASGKVPRLPQKFPALRFSCGISGIFLEISASEKYFSDSGKWPFHTPPIHTPTKCRGIRLTVELYSNPGVPRKFPRLPRNFPGSFPDFPGGQPFLWEAWHPLLTHKNFLWPIAVQRQALEGGGIAEKTCLWSLSRISGHRTK